MNDLIVDFPPHRGNHSFQNTMPTNLIVEFPQQQKRKRRVVGFADKAQLRIVNVKRHGDTTPRQELWYTKSEYDLMKLAVKEDVLDVRMQALAGAAGKKDDASPEENNVCCILGIEHLLAPAWAFEVTACRARCRRAVLAEQAKQEQDPSASARLGWEAIALASSDATRTAALRARKLGKLHLDSSERSY